jgi:tetratricopeptide (TPR) repeat protein
MLALLSLGLAAPLQLTISPEASLQRLPTVQAGRAEIIVYDNQLDLRAQIKGKSFDGIRRIWAMDLGDVWIVNVILEQSEQSLSLEERNGHWNAVLSSHSGDTLLVQASTLAQLEQSPPVVCHPTSLPLKPLTGKDMSYGVQPGYFSPQLPQWSEAEPVTASWEEIRNIKQKPLSAETSYRLGALHRDLGHYREAAYYFSQVQGSDYALAMLQRAGALVTVQKWPQAKEAAWQAWRQGAPEDAVLELLAIISLSQQDGQAAILATALAHATGKPQALLLSGVLLVQAGCYQEAIPILEKSVQYLRRSDQERATQGRMLLVDAYLLSGKLDEAETLLGRLRDRDVPESWAGVLRTRSRLLSLLQQTPDGWTTMIPTLSQFRGSIDAESAESLYLLGQLQEWLGDHQAAIETWLSLLDYHRELSNGDPGARLAASWLKRTQTLTEEGRDLEAIALHTMVWRPFLAKHIQTPAQLMPLVQTYRGLGLYPQAMRLLGVIAELEGQKQLDDQTTILTIARTYLDMGHPDLAEDALDVLQTRNLSPETLGRMWLLRGQIAEANGDLVASRVAWDQAFAFPATRLEAMGRRAQTEALKGSCGTAIPQLREVLEDERTRTLLGEGGLRSLYAWCLGQVENPEGSAVEAYVAARALQDSRSQRFLLYVSEKAATEADISQPGGPSRPTDPDIWSLLGDEEKNHMALRQRLKTSQ